MPDEEDFEDPPPDPSGPSPSGPAPQNRGGDQPPRKENENLDKTEPVDRLHSRGPQDILRRAAQQAGYNATAQALASKIAARLAEGEWVNKKGGQTIEGGQGIVSEAEQSTLGRTVARKRPTASASAEYFFREAVLTALLEHPGVVPVYAIGVEKLENGQPGMYYTMKWVRGSTLKDLLGCLRKDEVEWSDKEREASLLIPRKVGSGGAKDALSDKERDRPAILPFLLNVMTRVCDAVQFANEHPLSVVHRDLKPANIIVGEFNTVLTLDWGIAKIQNTELAQALDLSDLPPAPGVVAGGLGLSANQGTPGYGAPEQFDIQSRANCPLDQRVDVYALGAILYEILTLTKANNLTPQQERDLRELPPRERPDTAARWLIENYRRSNDSSSSSVRHHRRAAYCPAGAFKSLLPVALKALETKPEDRFQTVAEVRAEIEQYLDLKWTKTQSPGLLEKLILAFRRYPGAALASVCLLIVLVLLATLLLQAGEHKLRREREETNRLKMSRSLVEELFKRAQAAAELAAQRGAWDEATVVIDQLVASARSIDSGVDPPGKLALVKVEALDALGRRPEAAAELESAAAAIKADASLPAGMIDYWKAQFCEGFGGIGRAREFLKQAQAAGLPPAERLIAEAMLTDDEGVAADLLAEAARDYPFNGKVLVMHALAQAFTGRGQQAKASLAAARLLFPQNAELPVLEMIVEAAGGEIVDTSDEQVRDMLALISRGRNLYEPIWSGPGGLLKALRRGGGLLAGFTASLPAEGMEGVSSLSIRFVTMMRLREIDTLRDILMPWTTKKKMEAMLDDEMKRRRPSLLGVTALVVALAEDASDNKALAAKLEQHCSVALALEGIDPSLRALLLENACATTFFLHFFHKDEAARPRMLDFLRRRMEIAEIPLARIPADVLSQVARHYESWPMLRTIAARMLDLSPGSAEARLLAALAELKSGEYQHCLQILKSLPGNATDGERMTAEKYRNEAREKLREIME